ncbi:hypothetical protein Micbo1qcDRAFT_235460 [Microdochium bolleyi]|uniref:SET domain-containing protein n=1 Tax=Microdochium bolleyi TaxID=196109 RepID=A0A136IW43_9PEZI|nr:hypothetical protein Micbo1qcDRAFT_235460 [Microdochium bolleyi]
MATRSGAACYFDIAQCGGSICHTGCYINFENQWASSFRAGNTALLVFISHHECSSPTDASTRRSHPGASRFTPKDLESLPSAGKAYRRTAAGSSSRFWEIRASPGKGLGVFARVPISRGTQLMTEAPLFAVEPPEFYPGKGYKLDDMLAGISNEVGRLSEDDRAVFEDCYEHLEEHEIAEPEAFTAETNDDHQSDSVGSGEPAPLFTHAQKLRHMRIFRTNAYMLPDERSAMFPLVARINHSCAPNAANVWDDESGLRVIWASRDIARGEEIFVSYVPLLRDTPARRARLAQYGFVCGCEVCRAGDDGSGVKEDAKRRRLGRDLAEVEDALEYGGEISASRSRRMAKLAVKTAEELRGHGNGELWGYLEQAYDLAAEFWARTGDDETSEKWRAKAEEMRDLGNVRMKNG